MKIRTTKRVLTPQMPTGPVRSFAALYNALRASGLQDT